MSLQPLFRCLHSPVFRHSTSLSKFRFHSSSALIFSNSSVLFHFCTLHEVHAKWQRCLVVESTILVLWISFLSSWVYSICLWLLIPILQACSRVHKTHIRVVFILPDFYWWFFLRLYSGMIWHLCLLKRNTDLVVFFTVIIHYDKSRCCLSGMRIVTITKWKFMARIFLWKMSYPSSLTLTPCMSGYCF